MVDQKTPEYKAWCGAKTRCYNSKVPGWKNYGGRGITMSDEWRNSFAAFLRDVGLKPSPEHSLDRIDNDGPYTGPCQEYPQGNCRWATRKEQGEHRQVRTSFPFIDLTGQRFGRLLVLRRAPNPARKITAWFCLCDCGNQIAVRSGNLTSKQRRVPSCGCRKVELTIAMNNARRGQPKTVWKEIHPPAVP